MKSEIKCSKCNGPMTEGFIFDRGHYEYKQEQIWVEGRPEKSFWSGLKTSGKEAFIVQAYRCADCNYLEFYTTDKIDMGLFT
jgi:hypothetical protein